MRARSTKDLRKRKTQAFEFYRALKKGGNLSARTISKLNSIESMIPPMKIICSKCNTPLYEGYEVIQPKEIIQQYNSECPKCGKKLEYNHKNIEVWLREEILEKIY